MLVLLGLTKDFDIKRTLSSPHLLNKTPTYSEFLGLDLSSASYNPLSPQGQRGKFQFLVNCVKVSEPSWVVGSLTKVLDFAMN